MFRILFISLCLIDLVAGILVIDAKLASPALAAAPQETVVSFDYFCQAGCVTLTAWLDDDLVPSGYVQAALALAYDRMPESWRRYARATAARRTRILVKDIQQPGIAAYYSASQNEIVIDERWRTLPTHELASYLIAHEVVHSGLNSRYPDTRRGAGLCFAEETAADSHAAYLWDRTRFYGASSAIAHSLDERVAAWRAGTLWHDIVLSPGYHEQCLGLDLS